MSNYQSIYMDEVLPGLWLGSEDAADDTDTLKRLGINYILSFANRTDHPDKSTEFRKRYYMNDQPEESISDYFDECADWIHGILSSGKKILVHCRAGISRSPTIVIAYLIKYRTLPVKAALNLIHVARTVVPNFGFLVQLQKFEILNFSKQVKMSDKKDEKKTEKDEKKDMKESFTEYCARISTVDYGKCRWGAEQYSGAQAVYDAMIKTEGKDLSNWGVKIDLGKQNDIKEALSAMTKSLNEQYQDDEGQFQTSDFKDVDQILFTLCGDGWTLWNALEFVFKAVYPSAVIEVEKASGVGSTASKIAQSGNNRTGLHAWLLLREKIIRSDDCLKCFDP